ncbi:IS5 family transposase [Azotobacter chroococcum]|uniref:IS5 family transposase n=2 Tax=Azotobacter chroococcum TaxID=353 RepID=UPI00363A703D
MTDRSRLSDREWSRIQSLLSATKGIRLTRIPSCRRFVDAVLWILRSGAQWRMLPRCLGSWNSVFKRFARWCQLGVWDRLLSVLTRDADLQHVCIDSSIVRANACAAGAANSTAAQEALGRSRGGFGSKIHALTDALGLPIRFMLTPGQAADISQAIPLMAGIDTSALLADKGYDANRLLAWLKERQIQAVIPAKRNRIEQRPCDWHLYKERHVIECLFSKLKHYRRIATRYEKKASHFKGMLAFAAALLWLR